MAYWIEDSVRGIIVHRGRRRFTVRRPDGITDEEFNSIVAEVDRQTQSGEIACHPSRWVDATTLTE